MSTTTPTAFGPYLTAEELAKGKRKAVVSLLVALAAVVLSVVASRTVADGRLVVVFLLAGAMHFGASMSASVRWSRTRDFHAAD